YWSVKEREKGKQCVIDDHDVSATKKREKKAQGDNRQTTKGCRREEGEKERTGRDVARQSRADATRTSINCGFAHPWIGRPLGNRDQRESARLFCLGDHGPTPAAQSSSPDQTSSGCVNCRCGNFT